MVFIKSILKPYFRLLLVLFFLGAMTSPDTLAMDLPEIRFERSGDAFFISAGSHKTYRRYYHYLSTPEGLHTLFNSFVTGYLTLFVDFHAALEISQQFSNPLVRSLVFPSALLLLPLVVQSAVSWQQQQRLRQEQIRVDNGLIDDLFFIEMLYGLAPDQQTLEIRPIPESLTHQALFTGDTAPNSSLLLWQELYKSLQYHQIASVRLAWYEQEGKRGILISLQPVNSQEPSYHAIEVFADDSLPGSIDSALHNEWQPDALLEHSRSSQPVISLLKDEVIAMVTKVVDDPLSTLPGIPLESLITHLQPDSNAMRVTASLCHQNDPGCSTSLQLIWQIFPYPHYRQKLFFDDPGNNTDHQLLLNTVGQVADINLAELVMQTFECFLMMAASESFRRLPGSYLSSASGFEVTPGEPEHFLVHAPPALVREAVSGFSIAQWQSILWNIGQYSTPATMQTICQRLTSQGLDWLELLPDGSRDVIADNIPASDFLTEVMRHIPRQEKTSVVFKLLKRSAYDFLRVLDKMPVDMMFSYLNDFDSLWHGSDEDSQIYNYLYDDHQKTLTDMLMDAVTDKGSEDIQNKVLASLIESLPEPGKTQLISRWAKVPPHRLLGFFCWLLHNNKAKVMARMLSQIRTEPGIEKVLGTMLAMEHKHLAGWNYIDFQPLMKEETFKQAYLARKHNDFDIPEWQVPPESAELKSLIRRFRNTWRLRDTGAIKLFSQFLSDQSDLPLVHAILEDACDSYAGDFYYRRDLLNIVIDNGAASEIEAAIANNYNHALMYMDYLLDLCPRNEGMVLDRIRRYVTSETLANYLANWLSRHPVPIQDNILLMVRDIKNRKDLRPFVQVVGKYPILMEPRFRVFFAELLPEIFAYIIRRNNKVTLNALFEWFAELPKAQLIKTVKAATQDLPQEKLTWLITALNSLIKQNDVDASLAGTVLANILYKHPRYELEVFLDKMGLALTAHFTTEISQLTDHNTELLYSLAQGMDYDQVAYYLAEMTWRDADLWKACRKPVEIFAARLACHVPMVEMFSPKMSRYYEICSSPYVPLLVRLNAETRRKLDCPVCCEPIRAPAGTHHCGKTFCMRCLQGAVDQHGQCPACKQDIPRDAKMNSNEYINYALGR